jgi:hypothetical protein
MGYLPGDSYQEQDRELLAFVSPKVFCPDDPKRNIALKGLACSIVRHTNMYRVWPRLDKKSVLWGVYTMPFGLAGATDRESLRCCVPGAEQPARLHGVSQYVGGVCYMCLVLNGMWSY